MADDTAAEVASRALPEGERFSLILGSDVCYEVGPANRFVAACS